MTVVIKLSKNAKCRLENHETILEKELYQQKNNKI